MYLKCLLLLFVLDNIEARFGSAITQNCPRPSLPHGRYRLRQKSGLIKFTCLTGYELVGNKYATCQGGSWDVPTPICVKSGCTLGPTQNGIQVPSRNGAWVMFFCMPGYKLVGSYAIYCDGSRWNATMPVCVDSNAPVNLSCDFEDANLCGWIQDEMHDFDWTRINRATPSHFIATGPAFDHTYGVGGSGHYMYIESSSKLENNTARLLSPVYNASLAKDGCFSFYYHMYGRATGGLRIYQKPERENLQYILNLSGPDKQKYLLFELWGNQNNNWYRNVSRLRDFSDSFQIVIEGIRGSSYTSDIAIDDVAILQGQNCTTVIETVTEMTPSDSCSGRCNFGAQQAPYRGCSCSLECMTEESCCPDFVELCVFGVSPTDASSESEDLPETQKLVAGTTSTVSTTRFKATTTTTSTTTRPPTTKATTTTTRAVQTTRTIATTKRYTSTPKAIVVKPVINTTTILRTKPTIATTILTTRRVSTIKPIKTTVNDRMKLEKEMEIEAKSYSSDKPKTGSSGLKASLITITVLFLCVGAVWLAMTARGARGMVSLARLRGRTQSDPEVRYLNSDVDD